MPPPLKKKKKKQAPHLLCSRSRVQGAPQRPSWPLRLLLQLTPRTQLKLQHRRLRAPPPSTHGGSSKTAAPSCAGPGARGTTSQRAPLPSQPRQIFIRQNCKIWGSSPLSPCQGADLLVLLSQEGTLGDEGRWGQRGAVPGSAAAPRGRFHFGSEKKNLRLSKFQ